MVRMSTKSDSNNNSDSISTQKYTVEAAKCINNRNQSGPKTYVITVSIETANHFAELINFSKKKIIHNLKNSSQL